MADNENILLENSHLQLDNHSLFHHHSLRFHVYGLCIRNAANYPSHKRRKIRYKTRETKKSKPVCQSDLIHKPLSVKVIHSTGIKHNSNVIFLISHMIFFYALHFHPSFLLSHFMSSIIVDLNAPPPSLIGPHSSHLPQVISFSVTVPCYHSLLRSRQVFDGNYSACIRI